MKQKVSEWFWRYIPLEITATCTALLGGYLGNALTHNAAATAVSAAWAENAGYYAVAIVRELRTQHGKHASHIHTVWHTVKNIVTEFGLAECADSFFLRPFFMYIMPQVLGDLTLGIIAGKIITDVFFYSIAIAMYELRKKKAHVR